MTEHEIVVPLEQAEIEFYGKAIIAIRLPDGRIAATLSSLVQALDLTLSPQLRRIRTDEVLADHLFSARIETAGGTQSLEVLTAWAIPTWLTGIQLSRLAPEKRPAILAFKREAADVLYRHFSQREQSSPALMPSDTLVPEQPITKPERPPKDADSLALADYFEHMAIWIRWQADLERWRQRADSVLADHEQQIGELHSRLEGQEEVSRMLAEALERLGPELLTPAHQQTLRAMAKRLHEVTGDAYAAIYTKLGEHFHVAKYDQIEERIWPDVITWFKQRIEAAQTHQPQN